MARRSEKNPARKTEKFQWVERVPATVLLPLIPKLEPSALGRGPLKELRASEWASKPTTLAQAAANSEAAVVQAANRAATGDRKAVGELLEIAREFGDDPRIRAAMADLILADRIEQAGAGRPAGVTRAVLERQLRTARIAEGFRAGGAKLARVLEQMDAEHFEQVTAGRNREDYYAARRHPAMQSQLLYRNDQRQLVRRAPKGAEQGVFVVTGIRIECPVRLAPGTRVRLRFAHSPSHLAISAEVLS